MFQDTSNMPLSISCFTPSGLNFLAKRRLSVAFITSWRKICNGWGESAFFCTRNIKKMIKLVNITINFIYRMKIQTFNFRLESFGSYFGFNFISKYLKLFWSSLVVTLIIVLALNIRINRTNFQKYFKTFKYKTISQCLNYTPAIM